MASLSGQMGILLLDIMATRTSRCISNSININNNNSSNNNNSTSSSSSLSPVSRRTTHTIPTPRSTCPRGTGLPTLQTGTSTPCQANLGRDWSQTVSSSFLSFFFSEVFFSMDSLLSFYFRFTLWRRVWTSRPVHWARYLGRAASAESRHART